MGGICNLWYGSAIMWCTKESQGWQQHRGARVWGGPGWEYGHAECRATGSSGVRVWWEIVTRNLRLACDFFDASVLVSPILLVSYVACNGGEWSSVWKWWKMLTCSPCCATMPQAMDRWYQTYAHGDKPC